MEQCIEFDTLTTDQQARILEVCDRFEGQWLANSPPNIDDALLDFDGFERCVLLEELVRLDRHYDTTIQNDAEYITKFPSPLRDEISSILKQNRKKDGDIGENSFAREDLPKFIGKYKVIQRLGEGGQATVYRAWDGNLSRDVAIKISNTSDLRMDVRSDSFLQEGKIIASLEHPNMARVFDVDESGGHLFIVMEYVGKKNLSSQHLARAHTHREAAEIIAKIARAADAAHRHGILHLDIKPANIMIDDQDEPRLIDFGLGLFQHHSDSGTANSIIRGGTPAFMAPEQAKGSTTRDLDAGQVPTLDCRSDVFSLGATLYWMLTGEPPFVGKSQGESLCKAEKCDFDPDLLTHSAADRSLTKICLKAMSRDPADRYQSADQLALSLERYVNRGRRVMGVALALVSVIMAMGYFLWSAEPEMLWSPKVSLDLLVSSPATNVSDPLREVNLPPAKGDLVVLNTTATQPAFLYLIWIDSTGNVIPVYPWENGDWKQRIRNEQPVTELRLPDEGTGWPVEDQAAGMETILVLARREPLPLSIDSSLQELLTVSIPAQFPEKVLFLHVENGKIHRDDRAPIITKSESLAVDSVTAYHKDVFLRLSPHFEIVRATSFEVGQGQGD